MSFHVTKCQNTSPSIMCHQTLMPSVLGADYLAIYLQSAFNMDFWSRNKNRIIKNKPFLSIKVGMVMGYLCHR